MTCVRLWGERFRRHSNNIEQQQSQPESFAVAVIVVVLGGRRTFPSFPAAIIVHVPLAVGLIFLAGEHLFACSVLNTYRELRRYGG